MWMIATKNFQVVDAILETPTDFLQEEIYALSAENLRLAMRYQASEVNRLFFDGWGMVQVGISTAFLWTAWKFEGRYYFPVAIVLLIICVVLQFYVVPETIRLGRVIDFSPRNSESPEVTLFWRLHHTYTSLDIVKLAGVLGLLAGLLRRRSN